MYVSSYRGLVVGFLFCVLHCSVVIPLVLGNVAIDGGAGQADYYIACNSTCTNPALQMVITVFPCGTYAPSVAWGNSLSPEYIGGHPTAYNITVTIGGATTQADGNKGWNLGVVPLSVYDAPDFHSDNLSYNIGAIPGGHAANQSVQQQIYGGFQVPKPPDVEYSYGMPNPCVSGGNQNNNNSAFVPDKNYSGSPVMTPDGTVLQPGQTESNLLVEVPEGQSSVGITNQALDPESGMWQPSGGGLLFSNSSGFNGSWTNDGISFTLQPSNLGGLSDSLLTNAGGPIVWQPDTLSNTASTVAAGDSAILNGILAQNQLLSNLLSKPSSPFSSNSPSGGSSNVWVMNWPSNLLTGFFTNVIGSGTNGSVAASNVWVENFPWTNGGYGGLTSQLATADSVATNEGFQAMSPFAAPVASVEGSGIPSSLVDQAGADNLGTITVGDPSSPVGTLAFDLISFPSSMMQFYTTLRSVIGWAIVVGSLLANLKFAFECIVFVLMTKGVSGVNTGIWDSLGGKVVTAIGVGSVVLAMVVFVPAVSIGLLTGELTFLGSSSFTSASGFLALGGASLQWVDQVFPVWVMITTCGFEVFFFFTVKALCLCIQTAIRLLPGA